MPNCNVFVCYAILVSQITVGWTALCPTPIGINQEHYKTDKYKYK